MRNMKTKSYSCVGVSLLATAAASGVSTTAVGQDDGEDQIIVTGFRGSLGAALNAKRDETSIVDVVKAEDIADFPDLNLAESLQRIPGVAIDRQAGEGRQITVRGLGGDFTRVRVNGMEALTTGGGSDASGGTNRSRSFDFNTFASELFNELRVRKSQSAEIEEGSLGANVELRTAQPFDISAKRAFLNLRALRAPFRDRRFITTFLKMSGRALRVCSPTPIRMKRLACWRLSPIRSGGFAKRASRRSVSTILRHSVLSVACPASAARCRPIARR